MCNHFSIRTCKSIPFSSNIFEIWAASTLNSYREIVSSPSLSIDTKISSISSRLGIVAPVSFVRKFRILVNSVFERRPFSLSSNFLNNFRSSSSADILTRGRFYCLIGKMLELTMPDSFIFKTDNQYNYKKCIKKLIE